MTPVSIFCRGYFVRTILALLSLAFVVFPHSSRQFVFLKAYLVFDRDDHDAIHREFFDIYAYSDMMDTTMPMVITSRIYEQST